VPIREETRDRVFAVASELGYKPNLMARALRGSPSSLLGVIARDISDPFHIQILRGINELSGERGYRMFLGHVDYEPKAALAYASMFEESHADGIIVIGDLQGGDDALEALSARHRFVVGVTDRTERRQVPGVYSDSSLGTELAMEHLWSLGHRSIVCFSDARTYDGRLRADRYERFMHAHGVGDLVQIHITDQEPDEAYKLGSKVLAGMGLGHDVTAIYATSDTTAIGLMRAAYGVDKRIPDDFSIVGYDDIDMAAYTLPPLTTVSQTGMEMGREAARLLFQMLDENLSGSEVSDAVLTPELVVRESTAAVTA
jgi:DNA-binding LacI/PurR family transcriptional regulator